MEQKRVVELFQLVVEAAPCGILMVDHNGVITLVNRLIEAVFGYERQELIGRPLETLIPERYRARHPALRQGSVHMPSVRVGAGREVVGLRKDGTEIPVELALNPLELNGTVHGLGMIIDLTERKRAEATLLEQKALLREVVNGALDAIVTTDETGAVVEWNPQAELIFGFSHDEAVGRRLADLIIPAYDRDAHAKQMQQFAATRDARMLRERIERTVLRKSGEEFPVELTIIPVSVGGHVLFSSFIRDIRERKESDCALRAYTTFIESLFEHLPNMVFVKDARDLRFVRFNKAGEELLGYSRSELLGRNDYDFFPKPEADFFTSKDRETLYNGVLVDIAEETIQTKSKGARILHTKKIPIYDATGSPQYLLGISEDITERKQAEAAVLRARLAAEQASKAKSEFLANMSHEMRTPLTAIIGISDYLLHGELTTEQRGLVQRCMKASDGLLRLIEELLLAAKAESGTLRVVDEPFDLMAVLTESTALVANQAKDKGLALAYHVASDLPTRVVGDGHRLQQILMNLIRNAIKFTSAGTIGIHVSVRSQTDHGAEILFEVVDTGTGIPQGQEERIFERFSQMSSRSSSRSGVGLGLAICKQLVELMGGRIWAVNNPNDGSTFAFTVTLRTALTAIEGTMTDPLKELGLARRDVQDKTVPVRAMRILLAEDFLESQDIIRLYLRDTPHQLDCAASGLDAVTMFEKNMYDLVFMDLHMPDMDGYTATCILRNWEREQGRPPIPIIALTANGLTEARIESRTAGCDEFLTKPIKMDTLLRVIRRYASNGQDNDTVEKRSSGIQDDEPRPREVKELRRRFIANRLRELPDLQAAIIEKRYEQIQTMGHRIKGLAGSYGLDAIGAIGMAMEEAAFRLDESAMMAQLSKLADALRHAETSGIDDTGAAGRAA